MALLMLTILPFQSFAQAAVSKSARLIKGTEVIIKTSGVITSNSIGNISAIVDQDVCSSDGTILIKSGTPVVINASIEKNGATGTGFFCKIPYKNERIPVLVTNYHILNEKEIENDIKISINKKIKKIEKDNSRRKYTMKELDVTFIEIKPKKDEIDDINYMELDNEDINKDSELLESEYKKKSVYILHYPEGKLSVSYGLINDLIDEKINHYCNSKEGSSGCPILSLETFKIIGIHYGTSKNKNKKINYGTFIKYAIDKFNHEYNKKIKKNKEYKNEINIIYECVNENKEKIFGETFVKNNRNNIELEINGIKYNLISKYILKKGENKIKIIIKNKLKNLEYMFYECKSLKNINELKYLDTKDIYNFS